MFTKQRDTSHGSAEWASPDDVRAAGLFDGIGAPLGLAISTTTASLFGTSAATTAKLHDAGDQHHIVLGSAGSGKFRSCYGPFLAAMLDDPRGKPSTGTVVMVDPKGEALNSLGKLILMEGKREVRWLDPFNRDKTRKTYSLNPLKILRPDNALNVDDAAALADALIIPSGKDSHWDDKAKALLRSILLHVALDPSENGRRHLARVRDLIRMPWNSDNDVISEAIDAAQRSQICGGVVYGDFVAIITSKNQTELASVFSVIQRDTQWLDSPQMRDVVGASAAVYDVGPRIAVVAGTAVPAPPFVPREAANDTFEIDPAGLALDKSLLFLVLPAERIASHRSWLRLCIRVISDAFKQNMPADPRAWSERRHMLIDEFGNLGKMAFVDEDFGIARGYGVRMSIAVQSLPQLQDLYGNRWQNFISNGTLQVLGVNDVMTSEQISKMTGETTAETSSSSENRSRGADFQSSRSWSTSTGTTRRPLLTPDEVRGLDPSLQLIFSVKGLQKPLMAAKLDCAPLVNANAHITFAEALAVQRGEIARPVVRPDAAAPEAALAALSRATATGHDPSPLARVVAWAPKWLRSIVLSFGAYFRGLALHLTFVFTIWIAMYQWGTTGSFSLWLLVTSFATAVWGVFKLASLAVGALIPPWVFLGAALAAYVYFMRGYVFRNIDRWKDERVSWIGRRFSGEVQRVLIMRGWSVYSAWQSVIFGWPLLLVVIVAWGAVFNGYRLDDVAGFARAFRAEVIEKAGLHVATVWLVWAGVAMLAYDTYAMPLVEAFRVWRLARALKAATARGPVFLGYFEPYMSVGVRFAWNYAERQSALAAERVEIRAKIDAIEQEIADAQRRAAYHGHLAVIEDAGWKQFLAASARGEPVPFPKFPWEAPDWNDEEELRKFEARAASSAPALH